MEHHPHRIRMLWLSGVLHAFTHMFQVLLLPLYFLLLQDPKLGLTSVGQATSFVTILMLSYFIPAYPIGVLADRFSKKKLLTIGLVLNAAGFVGLAFAPNYGVAVAWLILSGIGGSFYHPPATALAAKLFPEKTGWALGWVGIGASVGFFLGPLYSGWRGQIAGWRAPVLEVGLAGLAAAALFYWLADEEAPEIHQPGRVRRTALFPSTSAWMFFLAAAFLLSLRDFAGSSMGSLGSLFLQTVHGLDPQHTGRLIGCIFLASAVSNPIFGQLSDRHPVAWMSVVLIIAAALVAAFPHLPVRFAGVTLATYGFFFMASYPMVEGLLMNAVPHHVRGRVFGVFITIGGILGNLAHWLMGSWVERLADSANRAASYPPIYRCLAVLMILALFALPCLRALRKREQAAAAAGMA